VLKPLAAMALIFGLAGSALVPAVAQTATPTGPTRVLEATFNVHARGMQAGEFVFRFTQTGATYEATAERRITGALRMLARDSQDYQYSVRGAVAAGGALRPSYYRHSGGRRDRVVEARFSANDIVTTSNPRMGMGDPAATQAQKRGAIDQISAIAAMVVADGDVCARTIPVYMDGRSRFDFVMHPDGAVNIDGSAYQGPGIRCRVEFRPIAGFGDPQEPSELTFLFARTSSGMYAPVRIEMPTDDAGIVVLDARRLTVNGQRLR
jgi:hypothetical protein